MPPFVRVYKLNRPERTINTSVVDRYADRPEPLRDGVDCRFDGIAIGDIRRHDGGTAAPSRDPRPHVAKLMLASRQQPHGGPRRGEIDRQLPADPPPTSCDE